VDSITKSPNMSDDIMIAFIALLPFALFAFANALPAKTLDLGQLSDEALEQLKMIDLATVCSPLLQCHEKDRLQFYATVILESISRILIFNVDSTISIPAHKHVYVSTNTIASSEDNYNDLPIDHIGVWRSLLIDPMESCHKLLTTATPQDTKVLNQAIDLLKALNFKGDTLSSITMRKTLFDCLVLLCISCPEESLARLVAIRIETTESVNNIGSTNNSTEVQLAPSKTPLNILQWLLRVPFSDENEWLRTYAGRWLGALLPFSRYKLLKSLYISEINSNLQQYFIPTRIFDDVDNMLHEFCGLTQSELSYTMKTVETAGTYSSNTNMHEVAKSCSR